MFIRCNCCLAARSFPPQSISLSTPLVFSRPSLVTSTPCVGSIFLGADKEKWGTVWSNIGCLHVGGSSWSSVYGSLACSWRTKTFFLPLPLRQPGTTTVSLCQSLPMLIGTVHQILVNESGCLCKGCKINTRTSQPAYFHCVFLCRYNRFRLGVTETYQKMHQLDKNQSVSTIYLVY